MIIHANTFKLGIVVLAVAVTLCHPLSARSLDAAGLSLKLQILDSPISEDRTEGLTAKGTEEATISLGEPLFIRIELANNGTNSVEILHSLDPAAGVVNLFMENPSKKTYRVTVQRWETQDIDLEPRLFLPAAQLAFETFLFGQMQADWRHEYIFPEKGKYHLVASYNSGTNGVSLNSNPVTISVGDPIPSWEELKTAGIVEYIEGLSISDQQAASRCALIAAILTKASISSFDAWLEKGKKPQ